MTVGRWYVYRVHINGLLAYVGKGCGHRYLASARRVGGIAGIVKFFSREAAAFRFEKRLIAKLSPPLNKTAGGEGGCLTERQRDLRLERAWAEEAYELAATTGHPLNILIALAFKRCEYNERMAQKQA